MRGRKPNPTALKILEGNPSKTPINGREPKPTGKLPAPPTWLTDGARKEWARLAPELVTIGILKGVDWGLFAAYCQTWAHLSRLERRRKRQPDWCDRVSMVTFKDLVVQLKSIGAEFGIGPASRSRLEIPQVDVKDDFEKFVNRNSG